MFIWRTQKVLLKAKIVFIVTKEQKQLILYFCNFVKSAQELLPSNTLHLQSTQELIYVCPQWTLKDIPNRALNPAVTMKTDSEM